MFNRDESDNPKPEKPFQNHPGGLELAPHWSLFGTQLDDIARPTEQESTQVPGEPSSEKLVQSWPYF